MSMNLGSEFQSEVWGIWGCFIKMLGICVSAIYSVLGENVVDWPRFTDVARLDVAQLEMTDLISKLNELKVCGSTLPPRLRKASVNLDTEMSIRIVLVDELFVLAA